MKKYAIIPIFLPHKGCPNDCVFCNQKKITSKMNPLEKEEVVETIETYLDTILGRNIETVEIAFFGGSFTGIPIEKQNEYLEIAKHYKDKGLINKIRLSTRPDYINDAILLNLKKYGVTTIELGVQSFDDEVLKQSNRGHNSAIVFRSSELIKAYGFELGIQLMIGLPGDTYEKSIESAKKTVKIKPAIARIYPTVVIRETALEDMYNKGEYKALDLQEAVKTAKDMYLILENAGIRVIRIGLKSNSNIVVAGDYHSAFRQLVESDIIKDYLESQLIGDFNKVIFLSNHRCFSNMIGNQKWNKRYFEHKYKDKVFEFKIDENLDDEKYKVQLI